MSNITAISLIPKSVTTITTRTAAGWGQIIIENGSGVRAYLRGEIRGEAFTTKPKSIPERFLKNWSIGKTLIKPFIGQALEKIAATKHDSPEGVDVTITVNNGAEVREEKIHLKAEADGLRIVENLLENVMMIHGRFRR